MSLQRHGFCSVEGTDLYYESSGSGTPVVFLHGNPADCTAWDFQMEAFCEKFQVIRYDLRGFGRSKPATVPYTHAGDLYTLLNYLNISRAWLIGWSMGGGAAINFALSHPQRVKGLVLIGSSLGGYNYSLAFINSYYSLIMQTARHQGLREAREQLINHPLFAYAGQNEAALGKLRQCFENYSGWHWLNKDTGFSFNPPAIERLGELKVPVLVIIGKHDVPDMQEIAEILATKIPGAIKVVYRNAGHAPHLELPGELNKKVLEFIESVEKER